VIDWYLEGGGCLPVFFTTAKACGAVLRPRPGDCCMFCSHGSVPCPPVQRAREGAGDMG
jgi:hypothetical protein